VTLSIQREITEAVRPPRALYLRWPFGRALGEPDHRNQQLHVLLAALELIGSAREPGAIVAPEWPWRRTRFSDPLIEGAEPPHA
jgi:D-proline reductase (dithiol) PrdB